MAYEGRAGIPGIVVLGVVLAFLIPPAGALICYIGMAEAKRRGEGVGLARAGIVLGGILTVLGLVAVATGLLPSFLRRVEVRTTEPGTASLVSTQNEKPNEKWRWKRSVAANISPGL